MLEQRSLSGVLGRQRRGPPRGPVRWASLEKHCCHVCLERMRDFPGCWELESDLDLGAAFCKPQAGALPVRLLDAPAPVPLQSVLHSSSSTLSAGAGISDHSTITGWAPACFGLPPAPRHPLAAPRDGVVERRRDRPSDLSYTLVLRNESFFSGNAHSLTSASALPSALSSANGPAGPSPHGEKLPGACRGTVPGKASGDTGQGPRDRPVRSAPAVPGQTPEGQSPAVTCWSEEWGLLCPSPHTHTPVLCWAPQASRCPWLF